MVPTSFNILKRKYSLVFPRAFQCQWGPLIQSTQVIKHLRILTFHHVYRARPPYYPPFCKLIWTADVLLTGELTSEILKLCEDVTNVKAKEVI